ncbi:MAG: MFS transporter [Gammaproteobacteria bacterium]
MLGSKDRVAIIIATGAFFICVTMGVRQSFGLYLPAYTESLGIGREVFAFAVGMQNLLWGIASPIFGSLSDRRGPVPAAMLGGILFTLGLLLMAYAPSGNMLIMAQLLAGAGVAGAGFSVILGAVGKMVSPQRRSLALGFVTAAGSFGQFAIVPIAQAAMSVWDARMSVLLMAGLALLLVICAPLLRLPATVPRAAADSPGGQVLRCALGSRSYVLLFLGFFVCGLQVVFVATHLPAYLTDAGLPSSAAVTALALIGLFNIFGSLACGWVGDKMPKKNALAIFYLLRSLVMVIFLWLPLTPLSAAIFGAALGFLWLGTVPLTAGLVGVMFGARHLSMLYGFVFFSHQLGSFAGAWLGGLLYDRLGSYDMAWNLAIIMGVVAAAMHIPIRERLNDVFARRFA